MIQGLSQLGCETDPAWVYGEFMRSLFRTEGGSEADPAFGAAVGLGDSDLGMDIF